MGCANTKAGGATVAEEAGIEANESQQKDAPKVMLDGEEVAVNGNVVNANGIEEGTSDEKETACNGDIAADKRKSSAEDGADSSSKNCEATTPSGDQKAGEEAKMADADEDNAQEAAADSEKADEDATRESED